MPHGIVGIISIGLGLWGLSVFWWSFTEMLLGLIPLLFVVGGLVAVVAGVKMVGEQRRLAPKGDGPSKVPQQSKVSEHSQVPEQSLAKNNGASKDEYRN